MRNVELVIWDLDGTLVNSLPSTLEAFNDGIEPFTGRRMPAEEVMTYFGPPEFEILARIVGRQNAPEAYGRMILSTQKRLSEVLVFDGILKTLETLHSQNKRLAIFTGRGKKGTDLILENLALASHFEMIVTGTCVTRTKPDPEGIEKICNDLGVSPNRCVMIGDSPADMKAARSAGAFAMGCAWDALANTQLLQAAGAQLVAHHPSQVLEATSG